MKLALVFFSWIALGCLSILLMATNAIESQHSLVGTWTEQNWEYEAAPDLNLNSDLTGAENLTQSTPNCLVVHQSEIWQFDTNGTLYIQSAKSTKAAKWSLKGRANVLVLYYPNGMREHYNISHISTDSLVLNFESQIQARGIAKLTFTRKNYVKKI